MSLKDRFQILIKFISSFRKATCELNDYPIRIRQQRSDEPPPVAGWELVPWVARVLNLPVVSGHGESEDEAYATLKRSFERYKERGGKLPRPGTSLAGWRWISPWERRRQEAEVRRRAEQIRSERQRTKDRFRDVYNDARKIINRHDPVGLIRIGAPDDEYEAEVGTILPRLQGARSSQDVQQIVHEEFRRWFGSSARWSTVDYEVMAREIWELWRHRRGSVRGKTSESE
jgi:hypothetical protein